jgi:methanogenic corrinoid protein MtbC1
MTTTMGQMKIVHSLLEKTGRGKEVKTMVGGAPITRDFARKMGANGYAGDAKKAVEVARNLLNETL